jgi:hypothetical protein
MIGLAIVCLAIGISGHRRLCSDGVLPCFPLLMTRCQLTALLLPLLGRVPQVNRSARGRARQEDLEPALRGALSGPPRGQELQDHSAGSGLGYTGGARRQWAR